MTTDELRAKFEAWYPDAIGDVQPFECYMKGYVSRDAEVEALKRDAERWRWLREHAGVTFYLPRRSGRPLQMDRLIDAAMREGK